MTSILPLEMRGAETRRRGRVLAGPVSLRLDGPGIVVLMGPNGSGKTSLLRLMHGTARLTAGSITWGCPTEEARQKQAFVFQIPIMLRRSVRGNIAYPLIIRGMSRTEANARAADWARQVKIDALLDRPAHALSGGESQKLAIARAMATAPDVLFLDEPCAALDGRSTREIEEILLAAKDAGTKLILSTHDAGQARRLADHCIFMLGGKVHEESSGKDFFDQPKTAQAAAFLNGDIVE